MREDTRKGYPYVYNTRMEFFKNLNAMKYYLAEMGFPHYINAVGYVITFWIFFLIWYYTENKIFLYIGFGVVEGIVVSGMLMYNRYGRILRHEGRDKMEEALFGERLDDRM